MKLYVDGGGTSKVPTYFSYKCFDSDKAIFWMNRFYMINLADTLLPEGCYIFNKEGLQTNSISELAALYYGVKKFREYSGKHYFGYPAVTILHDSEFVVKTMNGIHTCRKEHLIPWVTAIKSLWFDNITYTWIPREEIVQVLGH